MPALQQNIGICLFPWRTHHWKAMKYNRIRIIGWTLPRMFGASKRASVPNKWTPDWSPRLQEKGSEYQLKLKGFFWYLFFASFRGQGIWFILLSRQITQRVVKKNVQIFVTLAKRVFKLSPYEWIKCSRLCCDPRTILRATSSPPKVTQ